VRPTGLRVCLNRNNWILMRGHTKWEPARLRASDVLAEDWVIEAIPPEPEPTEEVA
jgi:hypothetical protein